MVINSHYRNGGRRLTARSAECAPSCQEPTLFPDLTVAENMFIGRQPVRPGRRIAGPRIDRHAMQDEAAAIF